MGFCVLSIVRPICLPYRSPVIYMCAVRSVFGEHEKGLVRFELFWEFWDTTEDVSLVLLCVYMCIFVIPVWNNPGVSGEGVYSHDIPVVRGGSTWHILFMPRRLYKWTSTCMYVVNFPWSCGHHVEDFSSDEAAAPLACWCGWVTTADLDASAAEVDPLVCWR